MNNRISLLGVLLAVQLIIVAVFWFGTSDTSDADVTLFAFEASEVDSIRVGDGESEVILERTAAGWMIGEYPADEQKVNEFLEKLANLRAAWPVAQSSSAATRFEVDAENYQRRLTLEADGTTAADIYMGTSPGYQRVHARPVNGDAVYSVALSNYELGVGIDTWLDKGLLALPSAPAKVALVVASESDVSGLTSQVLELADEGWLIDGAAANQEAATAYVNRYTTLNVLGLAAETPDARLIGTLKVRHDNGERTYTISKAGDDGDYFMEDASRVGAFRLATYVAEQLLMSDTDFSMDAGNDPATAGDADADAAEADAAEAEFGTE